LPPIPEQLVAAAVPTMVTARPAPAPVAVLPTPLGPARLLFGPITIDVARMDRSGRVRSVVLLQALGWLRCHTCLAWRRQAARSGERRVERRRSLLDGPAQMCTFV